MKKRIVLVALIACIAVVGAVAADLTIASQLNVTAMDYCEQFLTFKGALGSNDKDQYVLKPDATSGASRLGSTTAFNPYRTDVLVRRFCPQGSAISSFSVWLTTTH